MAEVAKTLPWVPAARTETDAINTMMSAERRDGQLLPVCCTHGTPAIPEKRQQTYR